MKKKILVTVTILLLLGISGVVLRFFPNEVTFKYFNRQGIITKNQQNLQKASRFFNQAEESFSPWGIASKNNELDLLYEEKKYSELKEKLQLILNKECSLSSREIPSFCENIFYLAGITQYRLGEKLDIKEQKPYFEKAIYEFQKSLALNPGNTWAKENIAFILKNFEEKQVQKQQKPSDKDQKKDGEQDKKNKESMNKNSSDKNKQNKDIDKSKQGKKDKKQSDSENKQAKSDNQEENNNQNNNDNDKGNDNQKSGEKATKKDNPEPSRLPENIKQALEKAQKDLEQDKNQQGFNRSKAASEKDKQNGNDPFGMFGNDPFFQNFFGNDPFFNPQKNLTKTITNPDEKDW